MSAREAWLQYLLCCHWTQMGLVLFLSREMHKWKFLTPQRRLGHCGATPEKAASLPRSQTHWVLPDKELEERISRGITLLWAAATHSHLQPPIAAHTKHTMIQAQTNITQVGPSTNVMNRSMKEDKHCNNLIKTINVDSFFTQQPILITLQKKNASEYKLCFQQLKYNTQL